jgi:hypothetical protein
LALLRYSVIYYRVLHAFTKECYLSTKITWYFVLYRENWNFWGLFFNKMYQYYRAKYNSIQYHTKDSI